MELDDKRSSKVHTHLQRATEGLQQTWDLAACHSACTAPSWLSHHTPAGCRRLPTKLLVCTAWASCTGPAWLSHHTMPAAQVLVQQAACLHSLGELCEEEQYISATTQHQQLQVLTIKAASLQGLGKLDEKATSQHQRAAGADHRKLPPCRVWASCMRSSTSQQPRG